MKKLLRPLSIVVMCVFLGIGNPVVAQTSDPNTTAASSNNENDDNDTGKWGLVGLLGLLGLLGLRKKDDDYRARTTSSTNR